MSHQEFQAVFSSPYGGSVSLGPVRTTLKDALEDRPRRSEETHEYLTGVLTREVTPWIPISLKVLAEEIKQRS